MKPQAVSNLDCKINAGQSNIINSNVQKKQHLQEILQEGHYESCFSKDVSLLRVDTNLESEELFLKSQKDTLWHTTVSLNEKNEKFKLDTDAEVMAFRCNLFISTQDQVKNTFQSTLWTSKNSTKHDRTIC